MNSHIVMVNSDIPSIYSGRQPFDSESQYRSYLVFNELLHEHDFPMLYVSPYDFDWEHECFKGFWHPQDEDYIPIEEPIAPRFIFDKAHGENPHCSAVITHCHHQGIILHSPLGMNRLCGDKWLLYKRFARFSPLSELITPDRDAMVEQLYAFFDKMDRTYAEHDNRAIVKPLHGYQARGIHIISRGQHGLEMHMLFGGQLHGMDIERNLDTMAAVPYLIQAWVNTGEGIPGIGLEGEFHDVRFIFGIPEPGLAKFILLYVKTLHGMLYVPLDYFGPEPFAIVNPIAESIAANFQYGIFCVDVMRDSSGMWYLTELNSQVGLTINFNNPGDMEGMVGFMRAYIEDMKRVYYQECGQA